MTPLSEKDGLTYKANYKPITILPNLSNVLERWLYNQLHNFLHISADLENASVLSLYYETGRKVELPFRSRFGGWLVFC